MLVLGICPQKNKMLISHILWKYNQGYRYSLKQELKLKYENLSLY